MVKDEIEKLIKLFPPKSKIVAAMSGGVDSSVTAALIKRAGFETIGVTLNLYSGNGCCPEKNIFDAKNIAIQEGFDHHVLNLQKDFKEKIIDNFIDSYANGITPAPCSRCNKYIKFGRLLEFCDEIHADYLVTGHYVKKKHNKLIRSKDLAKDQSYFLALVHKDKLKKIEFPLADLEKPEVRKLATEMGLAVAMKSESMDICFIPNGDYKSFLAKIRPEMFIKGDIKNSKNEHLGFHEGLAGYTIGQRKNLKLNNGPWYVLKIDPSTNSLTVGHKEELKEFKFYVEDINLFEEESFFVDREIKIQIRAHQKTSFGRFDTKNNIVSFSEPQEGICKGQICAFYDDDDTLLGGCVIKEIL